jgi:hypothetical protein
VDNSHFLNPEEIDVLLNFSLSSDTNWEVIVGSQNDELFAVIKDIFRDDAQVKIKGYNDGCDLLVSVARELPDLVVIDENIGGIPYTDIIKCMRRSPGLKDIKVFCNIKTEVPNFNDETCEIEDYISIENIDKIYIARKLNSCLYLSSTHKNNRFKPQKERRWPRISLSIDARIEILDPMNNARYDYGDAQIVNLSREGACISKIKLKKGRIPEGDFHIRLRVNQPPLDDWKADSMVIRMDNGSSAGLKFVDISKQDKIKIMNFFD